MLPAPERAEAQEQDFCLRHKGAILGDPIQISLRWPLELEHTADLLARADAAARIFGLTSSAPQTWAAQGCVSDSIAAALSCVTAQMKEVTEAPAREGLLLTPFKGEGDPNATLKDLVDPMPAKPASDVAPYSGSYSAPDAEHPNSDERGRQGVVFSAMGVALQGGSCDAWRIESAALPVYVRDPRLSDVLLGPAACHAEGDAMVLTAWRYACEGEPVLHLLLFDTAAIVLAGPDGVWMHIAMRQDDDQAERLRAALVDQGLLGPDTGGETEALAAAKKQLAGPARCGRSALPACHPGAEPQRAACAAVALRRRRLAGRNGLPVICDLALCARNLDGAANRGRHLGVR